MAGWVRPLKENSIDFFISFEPSTKTLYKIFSLQLKTCVMVISITINTWFYGIQMGHKMMVIASGISPKSIIVHKNSKYFSK